MAQEQSCAKRGAMSCCGDCFLTLQTLVVPQFGGFKILEDLGFALNVYSCPNSPTSDEC